MDSRKILSSDQKLNLYKIVDNPSSFSSKIITLLPLEREYLYNIIDPQLIIDLSFPIINEFKNLPNTDFITHLDYIDIKLNQVEKQILHSMYYLIATKFQLKAKDYIIGDVSSIVLNKHTSDFYDVYLLKKYILNSELFVEFNESASKEDIKENNFWYNQDKYYFYKQYGSTKILLNQLNIKSYYDGDHYYVRRDLFYQKFYNQINNLPFTFPIHATMHNLQDLDDNYLTFNELKNDSSPTTCYICKKQIWDTIHSSYLCSKCEAKEIHLMNQDYNFDNKVCIIIGIRNRFGAELCKRLLASNAKVYGSTRYPSLCESMFKDCKGYENLTILELDLFSFISTSNFINKLSHLKINYFIYTIDKINFDQLHDISSIEPNTIIKYNHWFSTILTLNPKHFFSSFMIHLMNPYLLIRILFPFFLPSSQIILLTSTHANAKKCNSGKHFHHNVSKSALNSLIKSISYDLSKYKIYANLYHPGFIHSPSKPLGILPIQYSVSRLLPILHKNILFGKLFSHHNHIHL